LRRFYVRRQSLAELVLEQHGARLSTRNADRLW
jgi:hypothetical protein